MSDNFQVLILANCSLMHRKCQERNSFKSEILDTLSLSKACIAKGSMFLFKLPIKSNNFFIKIFLQEFYIDLFNVDVCIAVESSISIDSINCYKILVFPSSRQDCDIPLENIERYFKDAFRSYAKYLLHPKCFKCKRLQTFESIFP